VSKITRRNLPRGVKLTPDLVFDPLEDAADRLERAIDTENLKRPFGTFWIYWNIPIAGRLFLNDSSGLPGNGEVGEIDIPFVLPELQDEWAEARHHPILMDLMVSWDQRDESAVIGDCVPAAQVQEGTCDWQNIDDATLLVRILKKPTYYWGVPPQATIATDDALLHEPTQEIARLEVPFTATMNRLLRQNPALVSNLNRPLDHHNTYVVRISAPNLNQSAAFVSLNVALGFKRKLTQRDFHNGISHYVQNMPLVHCGLGDPDAVAIGVPGANTSIEADDPVDGIQTGMNVLDGRFQRKLRGGYNTWGDRWPAENVLTDAGYDVIAVPMFGGLGRPIYQKDLDRLPNIGADEAVDVRLIPITHPFVVHHVLAVVNWAGDPSVANNIKPNNANLTHEIGVALLSGHKADLFTYQHVAYQTFGCTPALYGLVAVDYIKHQLGGNLSNGDHDQIIVNVPIVYDFPAVYPNSVRGYFGVQGQPFWMSSGTSEQADRTDAVYFPMAGGGPPYTAGQEQFIEVRWKWGDTVTAGGLAGAGYGANTVFVGYGGFWVYLIGKKMLAP